MTKKPNVNREALHRLAGFLVDDVMAMTDDEVLAEALEAGLNPDHYAHAMCERFKSALIFSNKSRLADAKAAVAAKASTAVAPQNLSDMGEARKRLRAIMSNPKVAESLTLAARKENELTDEDVVGMLEDLKELGVLQNGTTGEGDA